MFCRNRTKIFVVSQTEGKIGLAPDGKNGELIFTMEGKLFSGVDKIVFFDKKKFKDACS